MDACMSASRSLHECLHKGLQMCVHGVGGGGAEARELEGGGGGGVLLFSRRSGWVVVQETIIVRSGALRCVGSQRVCRVTAYSCDSGYGMVLSGVVSHFISAHIPGVTLAAG